jgi:ABC-type phosphate transport system substrate-binding protein
MSGYRNLLSGLAAAVAMATALSARAQTASQTAAPAPSMSQALRQALGVSGQSSLLPISYAGAATPMTPGVGRTSVDHSFGKGGGVTGSAGFLCGRGAGPDNNGAATAYGYDPEGRFVGAKLSIAFK